MDSPPASLESQRSQRDFSFNFLLSTAKEQWDAINGRKLKKRPSSTISTYYFYSVTHTQFFALGRIVLYVCRPLNGKHKRIISLRPLRLCGEN
jgi:hypothetical protein